MECKVFGVYKNLRYRILVVNNETYILDLGHSIWKILFPFLFWVFRNPVYKVDQETADKVKTPEINQKESESSGLMWIGSGIAVLLANLIRPFMNYFDIESSPIINSIIVTILIIFLLSFRFYVNYLNKKTLEKRLI